MGANDAREQLEVCKDEYGKLERENVVLRAVIDRVAECIDEWHEGRFSNRHYEAHIVVERIRTDILASILDPEPAAQRCSFDFHGECAPCVLPGGHQGMHRCLHQKEPR